MTRPGLAQLADIRRHRREVAEGALARARRIEAECRRKMTALQEERVSVARALGRARAAIVPARAGLVTAIERGASLLACQGLATSLSECEDHLSQQTLALRGAEAAAIAARQRFAAAARREEAVAVLADEARREGIRMDERADELASEDRSRHPAMARRR